MTTTTDYQPIQPGVEGNININGNNDIPPAYNPDAIQAMPPPTYGSVSASQPQQPQYIYQQQIPQQQSQHVQIQYVNQNGQPILLSQQQRRQQPIIIKQAPQPNTALFIPPTAYKTLNTYKNPSPKDKRRRIIASIGSIISIIILIVAMSTRDLASRNNIKCTILSVDYDSASDIDSIQAYYSDFCLNDDENWDSWYYTNSSNWCSTWIGASFWISCTVFSCIFMCFGLCWVQPLCLMERCCCTRLCPKICFIISLILCILSNVLWIQYDDICMDTEVLNLKLGESCTLSIVACVIVVVVIIVAK